MSSAAVQQNTAALPSRPVYPVEKPQQLYAPQPQQQQQQQQSSQRKHQQTRSPPVNNANSTSAQPSSPTLPSPTGLTASSSTPRQHHQPPANASSPTIGVAAVSVPPRSSSQYRTSTNPSSPLVDSQNRMQEMAESTPSSARRRAQQTGEHLSPALMENNENYTIHISDPAEDLSRIEARMAEARPHTQVSSSGAEGDDAQRSASGKSRRDGTRRREHKLGSYILGQTLGEGEFGKVKLGWKKENGLQVAIKIIRKDSLTTNTGREQKIAREIRILQGLNHPNIVRLHDIVNDDRYIGLALEYASGGELFDYILQHRYLKDHSARKLFAQLISGVGYLHKKGIVHRDLKLENLLLDRNRNIIITDFGFANEFNPYDELSNEIVQNIQDKDFVKMRGLEKLNPEGFRRGDLMQTSCGSPCYAAPELVVSDSLYTGRKVDVWSCGVILYAMLAGYLPFDDDPSNPEGDNINLLYKYIVSTPLIFPEWVTPHARDLLKQILVPDPRKRADLFTVARHSWLSEYAHVVGLITSSATTEQDIANTTVTSGGEMRSAALARSASVREPKTHPRSTISVGPQKQSEGETKTPREAKRHTAQFEYVAPQSASRPEKYQNKTNTITEVTSDEAVDTYKPTQQTPPPAPLPTISASPPIRKVQGQRAASENVMATIPTGYPRPATGSSTGVTRLPSRGNSYGQPAVGVVARESAQGKMSQPRLSTYLPDELQPGNRHSYMGPSDEKSQMGYPQIQSPTASVPGTRPTGHRRSTTLSGITERLGFGKRGSIFTGKTDNDSLQDDASIQGRKSRKHPPVSMRNPIPKDNNQAVTSAIAEPRKSTDSRRTSFTFGRKKDDASPTSTTPSLAGVPASGNSSKRSSRRFSLLMPFRRKDKEEEKELPPPPPPPKEQDERPRMAFGRGQSRSSSQSTTGSNIPVLYDSTLDAPNKRQASSALNMPARKPVPGAAPTSHPTGMPLNKYPEYPVDPNSLPYLMPPSASDAEEETGTSEEPATPTRTRDLEDDESEEMQHNIIPGLQPNIGHQQSGTKGKVSSGRPGVLQKQKRNFRDDDAASNTGSSGAARKVMDFFNVRRKARAAK